jgi:hypothetical protein
MPPVAPTQKVHVPQAVLAAFAQKYPSVSKPTWETEKGNYEANWGGSSGEDHAALFTPTGVFVEIVDAIDVRSLPTAVAPYVKSHYEGAKIKEAGKVTDAAGKQTYEIEIHGKDLIFDLQGNFVSEAKG